MNALPIRTAEGQPRCFRCDGTGVFPFNRHGTLQQCATCEGTGVAKPTCTDCGAKPCVCDEYHREGE